MASPREKKGRTKYILMGLMKLVLKALPTGTKAQEKRMTTDSMTAALKEGQTLPVTVHSTFRSMAATKAELMESTMACV